MAGRQPDAARVPDTELWTAPRLSRLIQEGFGVRLYPRYLSAWLRDRGFAPQKPERIPPG